MTTQPQSSGGQEGRARIPFGMRLKAWWNGYDVRLIEQPLPEPVIPVHDVHYERPPLPWETGRIALTQRLWGKGFVSAGGEELVRELVKPCGLSSAMSVLELGAGLGGCARVMAESFGTWVTALEEDPTLAEAGAAISEAAGLAKRAAVSQADHDKLSLKPRGYDVVFAKDCFYRLADKKALLESLVPALKPQGQLVFTDYVLAPQPPQGEALFTWLQREPQTPHPWTLKHWTEALTSHGMEVRVAEDISERWLAVVREPWAALLEEARRGELPEDEAAVLLPEAELWTRRSTAIEAGGLRIYRFYARLKPEAPK